MPLVIIFFFLFTCTQNRAPQSSNYTIDDGTMNISEELINTQIINLDNTWEFYWNELLSPEFFASEKRTTPNIYIPPGTNWKSVVRGDSYLPGLGVATYRMVLKIPISEIGKIYGIKCFQTGGPAQKIFIQGKQVLELGHVGISKETMIPTRESGVVFFTITNPSLEIIVQISNFHHADGAFWYAPKFGKDSILYQELKKNIILEATLLGCIFLLSLYQFLLYYKRRQDHSTLTFGIFCVLLLLHSIAMRGDFIYDFFPNVSYRLTFVLSLLFLFYVPFYIYFLSLLYPEEFTKRVVSISWMVHIVPFLLIVFLPTEIGSKYTVPGILSATFVSYFTLYKLTICVIQKREYSLLLTFSQFIYIVSGMIDSLSAYRIIDLPYTLLYSYFLYILIQSIILGDKYSKSYNMIEELSNNLMIINESLEESVHKRTYEYKQEKEKAENESLWKDKFISLVSHDLQSPLSTLLVLFDSILNSNADKQFLLKKVSASKVIILNSLAMVKHLLCMSRFQYKTIQIFYKDLELSESIQSVKEQLKNELDRKEIQLILHLEKEVILTGDEDILKEILRNIILNSIKFCKEKSQIQIFYSEEEDFQIIKIQDKGIGITKEILEKLQNRIHITTLGTKGEPGFGVGLRLCCDLMNLQGGKLIIDSIEGEGTMVSLHFPSNKNILLYYLTSESEEKYIFDFKRKKYLCIKAHSHESIFQILDDVYVEHIVISLSGNEPALLHLFDGLNEYLNGKNIKLYIIGTKDLFYHYDLILKKYINKNHLIYIDVMDYHQG
jgi:signal transduction histidine kinase